MTEFKSKISKEEIANYPVAEFDGNIYIIQTIADADRAVSELEKEAVLGFDTETRPAFRKGQSNKVALMQLSSQNNCFLFRLNRIGIPNSLAQLLANKSVLKIGLSLKDDFRAISKMAKVKPDNFIELQTYVKSFGIEEMSLAKIFAIIFGLKISKAQRLTNWEADVLTPKQKGYAALDAWATREIYMKLDSISKDKKIDSDKLQL